MKIFIVFVCALSLSQALDVETTAKSVVREVKPIKDLPVVKGSGTSAQVRQVGYAGFNPKTGIYAVYFPNYDARPVFAAGGGPDLESTNPVVAGQYANNVPAYNLGLDSNRISDEYEDNLLGGRPGLEGGLLPERYGSINSAPVYNPVASEVNRLPAASIGSPGKLVTPNRQF